MKYRYHPLTEAVYLLSVIFLSLLLFSPYTAWAALLCPMGIALVTEPRKIPKSIPLVLSVIALLTVTNPLFSQNGNTALLFINGHKITAEAMVYGFFMGIALSGSILVFAIISRALDADRTYCLVGKFSPRLAPVFSMTLSLVPSMRRKYNGILSASRLSGGMDESTPIRKIGSHLKVFSILITNVLEGGLERADAMTSRGYGTGKRTMYTKFKLTKWDISVLALTVLLDLAASASFLVGKGFSLYPSLENTIPDPSDPRGIAATAALISASAILSVLPTMLHIARRIQARANSPKIHRKEKDTCSKSKI